MNHKWNVGIECIKMGMFIHAFTHDLSKLLPSEFIPYAKFFHAKNRTKDYKTSDEDDPNFQAGWCRHQKRNKHHWNYWVSVTRANEIFPIPMPQKYVRQMLADWRGMARKFEGSAEEFYIKNWGTFMLHVSTERYIMDYLKITSDDIFKEDIT